MSKFNRLIILAIFLLAPVLAAGCSQAPAPLATGVPTSALPQQTAELIAPATLLPSEAPPTAAPVPTSTIPPTGAPAPSPTAPVPAAFAAVTSPNLLQIHMGDANNGWGLTDHQILRTEDGGSQWFDVTPKDTVLPARPASFFLDAKTGWAAIPQADFASGTVISTQDGGQTWSSSQVPFASGSLDFIDPQHGWNLDASNCGAGSCGGNLYQTQDGGKTWTVATTIDANDANAPGRLPLSGDKSGVAFADASHGWATGSIPMDNYAWLFATQDGGKTWQHQELVLPQNISTAMFAVDPPRFFGPQEGLLPVSMFADVPHKDFYHTQDGGKTWTASTDVASNGVYSIATAQDIWVWDGGTMYVTHDGAQTWTPVTPNVSLSQTISQLDFVSKTDGWVLSMDANGTTTLYRSTDGGVTWKKIP